MMTIEDKKNILSFIDTADSWISGYPVVNNYTLTREENPVTPQDKDSLLSGDFNPPQNQKNQADTHLSRENEHSGAIQSLGVKIAQCTRCPLSKTRNHTVPGEGCLTPLVLVIGEGPGADEDACGHPFVGKAGHLLDKMLIAIDLSRETNTFIANIVKCRPPQNRDPLPEEAQACRSFLDLQIQLLKPKMILAIGRVSAQNLLGCKTGIGSLRGKFFEYKGIPLMPTYHPSALLRNEELKRPAWEDLKRFRAKLNEIIQTEGL